MRLPQAPASAAALARLQFLLLILTASEALAVPVVLQNATATHTQAGFSINQTIDGNLGGISVVNGWALDNGVGGSASETAAYETQTAVGGPGGATLTFTLTQNFGSSITVGKFRLSVTEDDRGDFANGMGTGGDVTANWIVLDPIAATATNGATLTTQTDKSILASGPNPATTIYTVTAATDRTSITGIRLEVLEDPSLPAFGPGRAGNGNLVLHEFAVDAVNFVAPPNGDFDENGSVDGADLARWRTNFSVGATHLEGNSNAYQDSDVDGNDLLIWQRQLGSSTASLQASHAVPEPAALALLAMAALWAVPRR